MVSIQILWPRSWSCCVAFMKPGGHSYSSFGMVNPAFALGNAINKFSHMEVPSRPITTFNVGVIGGGISVNSIPAESWMEVDIRSESRDELNRQVGTFLKLMQEAAVSQNDLEAVRGCFADVPV